MLIMSIIVKSVKLILKSKSYVLRIKEVNAIYDNYAKSGISNSEIFRRYIYPRFGITERTFYNYLKVGCVSEIN